jgi:hypothetical protein
MQEIVIAERTMVRLLALLPAIAVTVAVRLLTLGRPAPAIRITAAAAIAAAAWVAYRLLTSRVVVNDAGVEVRGVFYEGQIRWSDLETVEIATVSRPLQALVWGVMQPQGLVLRGRSRTLRPIAAVCPADDEELLRALGAIRVRLGAWGIPAQRQTQASVTTV